MNSDEIEAQLKHCSAVLTKLKRNPNAGPFLKPVDPISLGIPDYFEKIKNPMDLSTIKNKLDSKSYRNQDEFNEDVVLMFNNCYSYNHPESVVHGMGKDLQSAYESFMSEKKPVKKVTQSSGGLSSGTSPVAGLDQKRRMDSSPTKSKRIPKAAETMNLEDLAFCSDILLDLEKSKHRKYSWPFLFPVTEEDAPGYFSVVENPVDLSTVRTKLDGKKYNSSQEFISDLNLMIENCFKYNRPDTEVYRCGEEFNRVIQSLVNRRKDIDSKILEIRRKISTLTQELKALEQQSSKNVFSLSERERIGKFIIQMNKNQAESIAKIVHRHCAYEYVDNDEIEINLQTMPDEVVGEIDEYIQKIKSGEGVSTTSED